MKDIKENVMISITEIDPMCFFNLGHAHLTDFNIATRLHKDGMACSMSGTKPVCYEYTNTIHEFSFK